MSEENKITEKELKTILGEDFKVKFRRYYKYEFSFIAKFEDYEISTWYGGDTDEIYRYEIFADIEEPLFPLDNWNSIVVTKAGKEILSYSEGAS